MTREELKAKLTPIVCDLTLTTEERQAKLADIFRSFVPESVMDLNNSSDEFDTMTNEWNKVMVEIVRENNLGGANGKVKI